MYNRDRWMILLRNLIQPLHFCRKISVGKKAKHPGQFNGVIDFLVFHIGDSTYDKGS